MTGTAFAILITIGLCAVATVGDVFLKHASERKNPLACPWFLVGFVLYASTAFGWVYVMRHLRFATLGAVYAVASVLLLTLVGLLFLGEALKWQEAVGIGMAVGSILLLARFA